MGSAALLVLGHAAPAVLARTLDRFRHPALRVFLHIDAKTDAAAYARHLPRDARLTPIENRAPVYWGGWGMVEAELHLIRAALADPGIEYLALISDDTVPLRPPEETIAALAAAPDRLGFARTPFARQCYERLYFVDAACVSLRPLPAAARAITPEALAAMARLKRLAARGKKPIEQVCFGRQWWALARGTAAALLRTADQNEHLVESFRFSLFPDEIFFPTLHLLCFGEQALPDVPMFARLERGKPPRVFRSLPEIAAEAIAPDNLFLRKIAPDHPTLIDAIADRWNTDRAISLAA